MLKKILLVVICAAVDHVMAFRLEMIGNGDLFHRDDMVTPKCDFHFVSSSAISFPI